VDGRAVLQALGLDEAQFADACHVTGHDGCPSLRMEDGPDTPFPGTAMAGCARENKGTVCICV
jgi:hypothetical protein